MATNIQYLKENNLYEAHKHFMRLSEAWMPYLPEDSALEEDGDDEQNGQAPQDMGGADPGMGGGDPNMGGGDPMAGDGDPGMGGADAGMGGDPNMGGGDPGMGGADAGMGGDPGMGGADAGMGDPGMGDPGMGAGPMPDMPPADDGETIDIDDLTKAQEKLNVKQNRVGRDLGKVDQRIIDLMNVISGLTTALDANNTKIENLKAEFEKRNPTQTEKLNLRSLDSYPFNIKPTDYWANKNTQGGYEAYADNSEPTTQEYTITNDDVDNPTSDIANTFFDIDDDDIQTLEKIFKA